MPDQPDRSEIALLTGQTTWLREHDPTNPDLPAFLSNLAQARLSRYQLQGDPTKFNAAFTGSQTIAGQQAQCYNVKSLAGGAFGDVSTCYSSNGVPLKTTITAQGTSVTMEATAFSTNVTDADFALPAAVR